MVYLIMVIFASNHRMISNRRAYAIKKKTLKIFLTMLNWFPDLVLLSNDLQNT